MSTSETWMLVGILVILVLLVLLSTAEMSLSRLSKQRARIVDGRRRGKTIARLVEDPRLWVNQLLLSVNLLQTVQATLTAVLAGRLFGPAGVAIGIVLNVLFFFVLTEAMPKTYAALHPERGAVLTAPIVGALAAFWPLKWSAKLLIKVTNLVLPGKGLEAGPFINEQEFLGMVEEAHKDAVIEEEERELIESVMELGDTTVVDIMVPAPDIVALRETVTVSVALDTAVEHQLSRIPVLLEDDGSEPVAGLLYAKDLIVAERAGRGAEQSTELMKELVVVPETLPVANLMRRMQAEKFHLALAADEYGSISGLVTLEDCLEELVGEIVDEHDDHAPVLDLRGATVRTSGATGLEDLNDAIEKAGLGNPIVDEDHVSVGGMIFGRLGREPEIGDSVEAGDWKLTVVSLDGRRINEVDMERRTT